jgi:trehalose 6-phosphate synthase
VLSKFAGAANELDAALLVNPNDIDAVARAMAGALSMSILERRERWSAMMAKLRAHTIQHWFADFLASLENAPGRDASPVSDHRTLLQLAATNGRPRQMH